MADFPAHEPEGYDCPFCRIVENRLMSTSLNDATDIVLQTNEVVAFISPLWWSRNPGHVLIVPRQHHENLYVIPADLLCAVHIMSQRIAVAMKQAYCCDGVSTRQHNEPAGNQDVWHYHLHIFPRYAGDDLYRNENKLWPPADERERYARQIRSALG